jgi:hypothetical protein
MRPHYSLHILHSYDAYASFRPVSIEREYSRSRDRWTESPLFMDSKYGIADWKVSGHTMLVGVKSVQIL